ncbi:MAG: amidase [Hyphomicrobiaceae bacterium]
MAVPHTVRNPGQLRQLSDDVAARKISPVELVERALQRITEVDPEVRAWRLVDAEGALAQAREREREADSGLNRGPLHGIPVGIKDIIDVEGLPTRCNSRSREMAAAATLDAEIVLQLRTRGAIVVGKTHTTEFAFFDPSPACNPYNTKHTPGGSSSGSAAAVASGAVPLTVGTQTVASVNRPAAYCGISAFKPSTRSMVMSGVAPLGPSYDTAGFYGWTVDDAVFAYEAVVPEFAVAARTAAPAKLSIWIPEDDHLSSISADAAAGLRRVADACADAGHGVERRRSPISFARLFEIQRSTMLFEAGRAMKTFLDLPPGQIGEKLLGAIRDGLQIPLTRYLDERSEIDAMRRAFFGATGEADVFLWPAAPATAPEGLGWTGDPKYISPWTALGGPIVSVPAGLAGNGLPVGCILAGAPGEDRLMCQIARRVAAAAERHA